MARTPLFFLDGDPNITCEYEHVDGGFIFYVMNKTIEVGQFKSKDLASDVGSLSQDNFTLHVGHQNDKYAAAYFGVHKDIYVLLHMQESPVGSGKWIVDEVHAAPKKLSEYGCGHIGLKTSIAFFDDDSCTIAFGVGSGPPCKLTYAFNHASKKFEQR